jgi:hypothetical protein
MIERYYYSVQRMERDLNQILLQNEEATKSTQGTTNTFGK